MLQHDLKGDVMAWVILVAGTIAIVLCAWAFAAFAEDDCGYACTGTAFRLEINGDIVAEDMTADDCLAMLKQFEPETPPFTKLMCVEYEVARQEL